MIDDTQFEKWYAKKLQEPKFQKKAAAEAATAIKEAETKATKAKTAGNAIAGLTKPEEPICANLRATLTTLRQKMKWAPESFRYASQTARDQQNLWEPHRAKRESFRGDGQKGRFVSYRAGGGEMTRESFADQEKGAKAAATLAMAQCARKAAAAWRPVLKEFIPAANVFIDGLEAESRQRCKEYGIGYRGNSLTSGLRLALKSLDKSIRSDDAIHLDAPSSFAFID